MPSPANLIADVEQEATPGSCGAARRQQIEVAGVLLGAHDVVETTSMRT